MEFGLSYLGQNITNGFKIGCSFEVPYDFVMTRNFVLQLPGDRLLILAWTKYFAKDWIISKNVSHTSIYSLVREEKIKNPLWKVKPFMISQNIYLHNTP